MREEAERDGRQRQGEREVSEFASGFKEPWALALGSDGGGPACMDRGRRLEQLQQQIDLLFFPFPLFLNIGD